jgi:hypothetical protein
MLYVGCSQIILKLLPGDLPKSAATLFGVVVNCATL